MVKSKLEQEIIDALEAVARDHGIDVVDVEIVGATKAPCVRVRLERGFEPWHGAPPASSFRFRPLCGRAG